MDEKCTVLWYLPYPGGDLEGDWYLYLADNATQKAALPVGAYNTVGPRPGSGAICLNNGNGEMEKLMLSNARTWEVVQRWAIPEVTP